MIELKNKSDCIKGGMLGGILEAIYILLVAMLMMNMEKVFPDLEGVIGVSMMLVLLVLSAAISGILVLGLPALLVIQKRIKEALETLVTTLFTLLGLFFIFILIAAIIAQ